MGYRREPRRKPRFKKASGLKKSMLNRYQDIKSLAERLRLPAWMANKYMLVGSVFAIILLFFDSFNAVERFKLNRELRRAVSEKAYYELEIDRISDQLNLLLSDEDMLETFAREQYLMKRNNEEVYVIVPE